MQIRAQAQELVVDRNRTDDSTLTAALGLAKTEEPHHVCSVAVEVDVHASAVVAHLVRTLARVANVSKQVGIGVLGAWNAEVLPEAPEEKLRLGLRPAIDGHARNDLEAAAGLDLSSPSVDFPRETRQWKILFAEVSHWLAGSLGRRDRMIELDEVRLGELFSPVIVQGQLAAFPCCWYRQRFPEHAFLRPCEIVKRLGCESLVHAARSGCLHLCAKTRDAYFAARLARSQGGLIGVRGGKR